MSKKNIYVVRKGDQWATRSEGSSRVGKIYDTQEKAVNAGRSQAMLNKSELSIQGRNGKFREKNSYGTDNYPPKG